MQYWNSLSFKSKYDQRLSIVIPNRVWIQFVSQLKVWTKENSMFIDTDIPKGSLRMFMPWGAAHFIRGRCEHCNQ